MKISAYDEHACGIDPLGALWCWGRNNRAELGTGDTDSRFEPTRIGVESDWFEIQAGENLTCGLRAVDQLWCWGEDLEGLGLTILNPRQVAGSYKTLAVGHDAWCAIGTDDLLTCRRRGQAAPALEPIPPTLVPIQIATTHDTTCAIDPDAQLWCWGENVDDQVGNGGAVDVLASTPHQIAGSYQAVDFGDRHTCALSTDGQLSCWGNCFSGIGRGNNCDVPGVVDQRVYTALSAGIDHSCAISDGKVFCFGGNSVGELGVRGGLQSVEPVELPGFDEWTAVTAGALFTCALRADNEAWCWGTNRDGQLGDGGGGDVLTPTVIDPGPWDAVFSGDQNGCAIRSGELWCWGANAFGQLGDGSTFERRRPVRIGTDTDWRTVAIGRVSSCGIREPGTLWCWGYNGQRQLGIGGSMDVHVPTQVGFATGWTEVAMTERMGCGVLDGAVHCWGENRSSMPTPETDDADNAVLARSLSGLTQEFSAIDTSTNQAISFASFFRSTVESPSVSDWAILERGRGHACGLRNTSELWCFGENFAGQLGQPSGNQVFEAVRESTAGTWTAVSAGDQATCAIATDGRLACMGDETLVGLGDDGRVSSATFVGPQQWAAVSVGGSTTCGVQLDGSLHCWGSGASSGRGDGRGGHERPTRVVPP